MNARTGAPVHRLVTLLVWIYCLSWAADFRGEQGGTAFQMLTFLVTAGSAAALAVLGWTVLFRRPLGWLILLWSVFLISSGVVAAVQHVVPGNYLRTIIPWFLVLTSMMVCQVASGFGLSTVQVLRPMLTACAVNVVWRAFYALIISGRDPDLVRVEMLSQCLPLLMALLMCGLVLQRRTPWAALLLGGLGVASYVFSVTRSAVFIIGAAAAGALLALVVSARAGRLEPGFFAAKKRHAMAAAGVMVAVSGLLLAANPRIIERWNERLFNAVGSEYTSMDPSALTRLAETEAFIRILDGDPLNYAFGMGIGQSYYWDEAYAVELAYTYGNVDVFRSDFREIWFPGHAIWTYAVFSGGFFSLGCHVLFFVAAIVTAWRAGKRATLSGAVPLHLAWLPLVAMLAFVSASLTFNPFIERAAGLVLGFAAALPQFILRDAGRESAARRDAARRLAASITFSREDTSMSTNDLNVRKQRSRSILLAVGTSILSKGGNVLLMLLAIPIAYQVLGEERAAIYGVMQSLMWLVSMADLGTGTGMVRRLACAVADGDRVRQRQIVSTAFLVTCLFALAGLLLLSSLFTWVPVPVLFSEAFAPYADEVLQTAWVSMGIFLTLMVLGCLERVREGFQEVHVGNVFGSVYNVSAALLLWLGISYFPTPLFMVVAIYGILIFFSAANATSALWKRRWLLPSFRQIDRKLLRSMTGEGLGLFFAGSVAPILIREAPKFMLGRGEAHGGAADVAHYWILVQLGLIGMGFVLMITRPLWPAMADAASRRDYAWIRNARWQMVRHFLPCAVIGVCAFSLIGPSFTTWWLKTESGLTEVQFAGYGLVFAFSAWSHLHYVMLGSIARSGAAARVLMAEAVLTLVLTWWGIHWYGLTGAIYASAAGMVIVSGWLMPLLLGRALREKSESQPREASPATTPVAA